MRKRLAVIHKDKCQPESCGNYLCAKLCPINREGEDCIKQGDETTSKAVIDEMLCTGCGICPKRCPFGAIEIINLPQSLNQDPIHRYGENSFALFSLPTPLFSKVVGLLGRNGIGKSTAFRILGGIYKPNLGKFNEEVDFSQVLQYFKGTQMQGYLERLNKGEITLSYKPQQVEMIPRSFKGTVEELLAKTKHDSLTAEQYQEVLNTLSIETITSRNITDLSGGELQRVAIAAATLKNATLTLFDEPSSYLDIKQRIAVSKFIRAQSEADESKALMVVEHDLVILDYMTDLLNILYGHESVYGIVSGIKNTREGINAFLEGFLKEENVRFRSNAISFENAQERVIGPTKELLSWKDLTLQFPGFKLDAQTGMLNKNEIVGILGENGIGKSSFVKLLAGQLKAQSGSTTGQDIRVSYKPQYLDFSQNETLVVEYLQDTIAHFKTQLIDSLDLEKLYTKQLKQLSGGELQRVSIAHCLSKDAELFLLDEPSAYLDVEQRLHISKLLKKIAAEREITILVVDHDLMFIDYLADRILVFTGTPSEQGTVTGPFAKKEGMNVFLKELGITLRRDHNSHRPRINKDGSVKDREQRSSGQWYAS